MKEPTRDRAKPFGWTLADLIFLTLGVAIATSLRCKRMFSVVATCCQEQVNARNDLTRCYQSELGLTAGPVAPACRLQHSSRLIAIDTRLKP